MKLKTRLFLSIVAVLTLFCVGKSANAGEPTEAIRGAVNQAVEILKDAKLDNQKQRGQIIDRLRQIVYPLFDFNEMAMRSLGAKLAPPESAAAEGVRFDFHGFAGKDLRGPNRSLPRPTGSLHRRKHRQ